MGRMTSCCQTPPGHVTQNGNKELQTIPYPARGSGLSAPGTNPLWQPHLAPASITKQAFVSKLDQLRHIGRAILINSIVSTKMPTLDRIGPLRYQRLTDEYLGAV